MVGHSWVSCLQDLDLLPPEFSYLGYGGTTFSSLAARLEHKQPKPSVEVVFVFAGSNNLDNVATTAEVNSVFLDCQKFEKVLKTVFPSTETVFRRVEDRYNFNHREDPSTLNDNFKRKSNKFNKLAKQMGEKEPSVCCKGWQWIFES